jgi:hypothetical protein
LLVVVGSWALPLLTIRGSVNAERAGTIAKIIRTFQLDRIPSFIILIVKEKLECEFS